MSQSWIRGPVCGIQNCPSRLYTSSDGHKICQYGHVLEGDIEINDDDGEFTQTRRLQMKVNEVGNLVHTSQVDHGHKRESKRFTGDHAKEVCLKCLQIILKAQVAAIVKEMYHNDVIFRSELTTVVKLNWTKLLESYIRRDSFNTDDGDVPRFHIKPRTRLPGVLDLVFVVYYSILQLNCYPIYLSDLIKLVASNKVPALRTHHILPKQYVARLGSEYHATLHLQYLTEHLLYSAHKTVYKRLAIKNLSRSINYYYPFILKIYFEELLLPNAMELFVMVDALMAKLRTKFTFPRIQKHMVPDVLVVCLMIIVVKIHFAYLNNKMDHQEWINNVASVNTDNNKLDFVNKSNKESVFNLAEWSDSKISTYCSYLNDIYLKSNVQTNERSHQNAIMMDRLFQIFSTDESEFPSSAPSEDTDLNTCLKSYAKADLQRITPKEIHVIEDFLFVKFAGMFHMSIDKFYKHYDYAEQLVHKCV
ncbi:Pol I core factor CF [Yamadazyma tenuis]|uniref:Uncharacterized protein n=1 Tax=Candida tenuis (strain ATCC 10573 / BCRC 21748 / CBS 615 / JCM 9827 / NBRC 10315 / NRRL Y-1498 / VKM Y-70) TaxID=590646 RepID=G3AVZ4_CANTC|nr:uncharacterized protein CANTEDRAFT_128831 [Yamadazyma tenuis ATCC 10573]XP_006683668.1 uncharacterized protein CANTEDRAFT_128831 [Yamadazyma tenuis ATCC 10573]EGV66409.1 hypothetical protein CANTEDRAFT_128831 [Yamadazyma tenuis ATCC 10573]EGV66410.1 hypothetical protein CANTEDRAFT_128831 [Yamadazyma tenuis ATCC 10573]WEJ95471.1 Pol I core factor CF [Yamadazyma tenuis]